MQQVKSEAFLAGARMVDPRALPVPIRTPRHKLANRFNRALVLHGRLIRRGVMVAALLAGCVALYQVREPIGMLAGGLGAFAQGNFAQAGLAIGEIVISGQTLTSEQEIFDALGIQPHTSTLGFDVEAARQRIAELPAIETVTVRKTYPGDVTVLVTEKQPVARWAVDGVTFLIDGKGEQIGEARGGYADLPLVIGDGVRLPMRARTLLMFQEAMLVWVMESGSIGAKPSLQSLRAGAACTDAPDTPHININPRSRGGGTGVQGQRSSRS